MAALIGLTLPTPARAGVDNILRGRLLDRHTLPECSTGVQNIDRQNSLGPSAHQPQVQLTRPGRDAGNACTARKCRCVYDPWMVESLGVEISLLQIRGRMCPWISLGGVCGLSSIHTLQSFCSIKRATRLPFLWSL